MKKTLQKKSHPITESDSKSCCKARDEPDINDQWRRHDDLEEDEDIFFGQCYVVRKNISIHYYFDISEKVVNKFRIMYESIKSLPEDVYVFGKCVITFLSDGLPTHPSYDSVDPEISRLRQNNVQQLNWIKNCISTLSTQVDKEQIDQYILQNMHTIDMSSSLDTFNSSQDVDHDSLTYSQGALSEQRCSKHDDNEEVANSNFGHSSILNCDLFRVLSYDHKEPSQYNSAPSFDCIETIESDSPKNSFDGYEEFTNAWRSSGNSLELLRFPSQLTIVSITNPCLMLDGNIPQVNRDTSSSVLQDTIQVHPCCVKEEEGEQGVELTLGEFQKRSLKESILPFVSRMFCIMGTDKSASSSRQSRLCDYRALTDYGTINSLSEESMQDKKEPLNNKREKLVRKRTFRSRRLAHKGNDKKSEERPPIDFISFQNNNNMI